MLHSPLSVLLFRVSAALVFLVSFSGMAAAQPAVSTSVNPSSVGVGGTSSFNITIDNSGGALARDLSIDYTLPSNTVVSGTPSTTCATGAVTSPTVTTISFASTGVATGDACVVAVPISPSAAGTITFPILTLTTDIGSSDSSTVDLTVDATAPILTHNFDPSSVPFGADSALIYTLDNTASASGLTAFSVTDPLPGNVALSSASPTTTCNNVTLNANTTANQIEVSSGFGAEVVAAGTSCTITFGVSGASIGTSSNTIDTASAFSLSTFRTVNLALDNAGIVVQQPALDAPLLTKDFAPSTVSTGGTVDVSYTVLHRARDGALSDISFTDTLAASGGPQLTFDSVQSNTCGATVPAPGGTTLSVTDGTITTPGDSCEIIVRYTAGTAGSGAGTFTYATSAIQGTLGGTNVTGGATSASLTTINATQPGFALSLTDAVNGGGTITADFTVTNLDAASTLENGVFTVNLSSSGVTATSLPPANSCGSGSFFFTSTVNGSQILTAQGINLAANASCSLSFDFAVPSNAPSGATPFSTSALNAEISGFAVSAPAIEDSFEVSGGLDLNATQTFSGPVLPGGTSTLVTTLAASAENFENLTNVAFTHNLDAALSGLSVSTVDGNTCGANVTPTATGYSVSGGTLAPGATCDVTLTVSVPASAPENSNTQVPTTVITGTAVSAPATTLEFGTVAGTLQTQSLTFDLEIIDAPLKRGDTIVARYTISNSSTSDATSGVFTHNYGGAIAGLAVDGALPATPCGSGSSLSGTTFLIATGLEILAGASCTFDVTLRGPASLPASDAASTSTSALSVSINGSSNSIGAASASIPIELDGFEASKFFASSTAVAGGTVQVAIDLNTTTAEPVSSIAFSDDVDAFVSGATVASVDTNTCGPAAVSGVGTGLLSVSGGQVAGNGSCQIAFTLNIPAATAGGTYVNTTSNISGVFDFVAVTVDAVSDELRVFGATAPEIAKSFSPSTVEASDTTTVTYTINNPAAGAALGRLSFTDDIGTAIPGATFTGATTTCGSGASVSGTSTLSLSGGELAPGNSCTVSATVSVPSVAAGAFPGATSGLLETGVEIAPGADATLTVTAPQPSVTVSVTPGTIPQGGTARLTYAVDNTASGDALAGLNIAQVLGTVQISGTPNLSNTCGGTPLTGPSFGLTGGGLAAGATCSIAVDITSVTVGAQTTAAPTVSTALGTITVGGFTLNVTAAPVPGFAQTFVPATITEGETTRVTYTVDNTSALIPAASLGFSNTLPSELVVAPTPNASTTCTGGTVTATAGATSIALSGGSAAASATCTVSVNVRAILDGTPTNTTGDLTTSLGTVSGASATLTINPATPPVLTKAFSQPSIEQGTTNTVTLTIDNSAAAIAAAALSVSDTLPAGMAVASAPNASTTCSGGTLTAVADANVFSYSGGTVAAGAGCTISVDVVQTTIGTLTNTTGQLTSSLGTSAAASANSTANEPPTVSAANSYTAASIRQGEVATYQVTLTSGAAVLDTPLVALQQNFPSGVLVADPPNASTTCAGGTVTATGGGTSLSLTGGTLAAAASCTVSVDVTSTQVGTFPTVPDSFGSSFGTVSGASTPAATLTVLAAPAPTVTGAIAPNTFVEGATATLTYTLDNSGAAIPATVTTFSDVLPTNVTIAATPNATTTCSGGTLSASGSTLTFSGGEIPRAGTCTVSVDITSAVAAVYNNTVDTFDTPTGVQTAIAPTTVTVTDAPAPAVSLGLVPATVAQGGTSRLTIGVDNSGALISADSISIDLLLPAGVTLSSTPNAVTDCGPGNVLPLPSGAQLTAVSLAAGATCSASVDVIGLGVGGQTISTQNATSSLGASADANAVLTVTAADVPTFTKVFSPDTVVQGAIARMTITIDNTGALVPASSGSFSDLLPAGIAIARDPRFESNCSGPSVAGTTTLTTNSLAVTGITVAAQEQCTYSVDVQSLQAGSVTSTSGPLTTSLGNSGTAAAVLNVTAAPVPTLTAAFAPSSIVQGGTTTFTVSIDNSTALLAAQALNITVPLPTDMTIAAAPNASTTCTGGTLTATAGQGSATYAGGLVPIGGACEVTFDVTSTSLSAAQTVTTSVLQTSIGTTAAGAAATLNLQPAPLPGFAKSFSPVSILQGEVSTVSYQIDNSAALVPAGDLAFTDSFPNGIVIADTPNVTNSCGATVTAAAASGTLTVASGTLAAGATCDISVDVTSATAASSTSTTGDLTTTLGNSGTASADLTVGIGPVPTLSVSFDPTSIPQGGTSRIDYVVTNIARVTVTDIDFSAALPTGAVVAGTPNLGNDCSGTATANASAETISLSGGNLAVGATCTVSADVTSATVGTATAAFAATSSQGTSPEATADLTVTAAPVPTLSATVTPDTIIQGDVTVLQVTVDNSAALVDGTDVQVSFDLPAALTIAPTPNASTTCGAASITATAGASSFLLSGGTVSAGGTCLVDVSLRAIEDGATSVVPAVTSSLGDSGTTAASLTVNPASAPGIAVSFAPSSVTQGFASTLTIDIDNSGQLVDASGATLSAALQSGLVIASPLNATTTCGSGVVSATPGASTFDLAAGVVGAAATCSVSVDVSSATVGSFAATIGDLTTSLGTTPGVSTALTVTASPAPGFASAFTPSAIPQGGTSTLVFTVNNTGGGLPQTGLSANVVLPAGLTFASAGAGNTCGGTFSVPVGGSTLSLSGGTVAAQSECTFSANVTSTTEGTVGAISGSLTSSAGTTAISQPGAPLVVVNNPNGSVTFVQNSSTDDTFAFTSPTAALNFTIATSGGTGRFGPVDLPGGTYTVTQNRPEGVGNTSVTCSDPDSVAVTATGVVSITLDALESLTCTFDSVSTRQETVDQINSFLHRRNNLLLSNQPSSSRRMARLNQGIGRTQTLQFQQGNLGSINPFNFDLLSLGSGNYSVSTSLNDLQRSAHLFRLAFDGEEGNAQRWTPNRWDVWFEASYTRYEASQGSDGHFGIAHLGTDYLVNENLLVGLMFSVDSLDDGDDRGATIEGDGWMFGPYVTARLAPNLIFDGRLAYGQSSNTISPFGTYEDEFDTDRLLIDASLSGSYDWENWVVTPNLSISYIEDRADTYVDSLNVVIPGQTVSLGQIRFGPTFSTTMQGQNRSVIEPSFAINGIYNFGDTDGVTVLNDTSNETDGLRARLEAAVRITNRYGAKFEFGANYDGIGADDFESYGARFQVSIPLQ